jgi:hypothetical protein
VIGGDLVRRQAAAPSRSTCRSAGARRNKFRAAPEAHLGKVPIVELSRTIPVVFGRGARQRTLYAPCFTIVGWTDRPPAMGERTVPPPTPPPPASTAVATSSDTLIEDEIPF